MTPLNLIAQPHSVAPGGQVQEIPLDLLDANPLNPRRTMNEASLAELAESMKQSGILNPLKVRPVDIEGCIEQRYEIVCGHRRAEAATLAGLDTVPCIVQEMSDADAAVIALVDNSQREDVSPMQEAEALKALLGRMTGIPAVAMRVGKDLGYVTKRLKLCSLGAWPAEALNRRLITIDHALLLARLGLEEQDGLLKWCLDPQAGVKTTIDKVIVERIARREKDEGEDKLWRFKWEPQSVLQLKSHIEQSSGRKLARAPWSLDDETLVPEAPACSACPSNTKANTSLFGDLDIEEATCADGGCFEVKRSAFVDIALKSAAVKRAGYDKLPLRVSWKETSTEPRFDIGEPCAGPVGLNNFTRVPRRSQILKAGQWVEAKKGSCPHAEAAVTVDWSDDANRGYMGNNKKLRKPGEILLICAAPKCKAHRKRYEKPENENANSGSRLTPDEEKAAAEKRQALAIAEDKLRMALVAKALEGITSIPIDSLRATAIAALPNWAEGHKVYEALLPGLVKILSEAKHDDILLARAFALASIDHADLVSSEYRGPTHNRSDLIASVRRLGYKGPTPWEKPEKQPAEKPLKNKVAEKAMVEKVAAMGPDPGKKKIVLDAAAKKRIADAQKKRWAKAKKTTAAKKAAKR